MAHNAVERVGALDRATVRKHVEARFSVDRMTDDYLRVYQEVLLHSAQPLRQPVFRPAKLADGILDSHRSATRGSNS